MELCVLPQKPRVCWTAQLQALGNLGHRDSLGGTIVKWHKAWPLGSNPGPSFSCRVTLRKFLTELSEPQLTHLYMEVITLNTEMMYVKQLLNRKSSKFTAISLSQPITAGCFLLSGSSFHVFLWPEPLLPCLFCSLDLPQALTLPLPCFLPPPSFVHFPCSPGGSSPCVGPIPSKVHDQEPL